MKTIIILLSVIMLSSCSLLSNNGEKDIEVIKKAEKTALTNIEKFVVRKTDFAKKEIDNAVASVISQADSTLTKQFTAVEKSLNTKAEKTKNELSEKISGIEDNIATAKVIGFIGIIIGILGIVLALLSYKKSFGANVNKLKDLIVEEINSNDSIRNEIRRITSGQNSSYHSQTGTPSQETIERIIEIMVTHKKFKDIISQYMSSPGVQSQDATDTSKTEHSVTPVTKTLYQIYAKESNSMLLSNIQDTYQKGKSIYKLIMSEPNSSTAEISVCIEQEEVKQRILKFDSQYLEPICSVIRSSNEPTQVIIKTTGTAERTGEEWKVIRPIIVEIK